MVAICKEMLADNGIFVISVVSVGAKLGIHLIEFRIDVTIVGSLHFEEIGGHRLLLCILFKAFGNESIIRLFRGYIIFLCFTISPS